jgi:hypothetical protein
MSGSVSHRYPYPWFIKQLLINKQKFFFTSIHKPPAALKLAPMKHALAVTVEPFQFSPAKPVAYEWSQTEYRRQHDHNSGARIWNAETGEALRDLVTGADEMCGYAAISADGRVLVSNFHDLEIWNAETGERLDFI